MTGTVDVHNNLLTATQPQTNQQEITVDTETGALTIRRLRLDELDLVWQLTRDSVDVEVAPEETVRQVLSKNPDSFWGVFRTATPGEKPTLAGYYCFLLFNERGAQALLDRSLDAKNPSIEFIAEADEIPHAVYIWLMVVKGLSRVATPIVTKALGKTCAGRPLYASAGTQAGLNLMRRQGFHPVTPKDDGIGGLFLFGQLGDLKVREMRAHYLKSRFEVSVVSTSEEMEKVRTIRGVFIIEQNCPYEEEFDGNDFTCTHLIGTVDGEPASTMRIRYFSDFVKLERLAVLPRFRHSLIARETVKTGLSLCRKKGYTKAYGHAQKRLVPFWSRFGFKPLQRNYQLIFSDHEYVEMCAEFPPHDCPITMQSAPQLFLRPEGRLDTPGILEKSAERPPTNPH